MCDGKKNTLTTECRGPHVKNIPCASDESENDTDYESDAEMQDQMIARPRSVSENSEDFIIFEGVDRGPDDRDCEDYGVDVEEGRIKNDFEHINEDYDEEDEGESRIKAFDEKDSPRDGATRTKKHRYRSDEEDESRKKVKFNLKPEVHVMIQWDFAYREARKGPWEMYARDRDRFKCRIQRTERELEHVLTDKHRSKIYQQRFQFENEILQDIKAHN